MSLNVCRGFGRWELPAADDLAKYQEVYANSGRLCILLNVFLQIVCNLQAKRDVRAAYEISFLAVLSVFRHTIEFERLERLHFGRRTRGGSGLSAGGGCRMALAALKSGVNCWRHGAAERYK